MIQRNRSGRTSKGKSGLHAVAVSSLSIGQQSQHNLYHETAVLILAAGEKVTKDHLQAFAASGIKEIYECRTEEDLHAVAAATQKNPIPLTSVAVGTPTPHNIYDHNNRFLLQKGRVLTAQQFERMVQASVQEVFIDEESRLREVNNFGIQLTKARAGMMEGEFQQEENLTISAGRSALPALFGKRPAGPRKAEQLRENKRRREAQTQMTEDLLGALKGAGEISIGDVNKTSDFIYEDIYRDIDLTLTNVYSKDTVPGEFRNHCMNVATLSIGMGLALGFPENDVKDLGAAAMLHEVGMFQLPNKLLAQKTELSWEDKEDIKTHPIHALNYLDHVRGISNRTALVVYQEHEAPNRGGYPNKRPAPLIHDFAKIISICDSYDAMTAERPFRDPMLPYKAMEALVQDTSKLKYDPKFMRAFLQMIGLFPVGSWVMLSDGRVARVTGNNHEKYDRPKISIVYGGNKEKLDVPESVDLATTNTDAKIVDIPDLAEYACTGTDGF